MNHKKPIDYTGQKYNRLIFIERSETKTNNGRMQWLLVCECGGQTLQVPCDVSTGRIKSCGCMIKDNSGVRKYDPRISTAREVWRNKYKDGCPFDLFLELSQLDCHYCGRPPHRTRNLAKTIANRPNRIKTNESIIASGDFTYNGLDRIDSSKDHSPDNIVPCCLDCNRAKSSLTFDEFLDHVERMYNHTRKYRK